MRFFSIPMEFLAGQNVGPIPCGRPDNYPLLQVKVAKESCGLGTGLRGLQRLVFLAKSHRCLAVFPFRE